MTGARAGGPAAPRLFVFGLGYSAGVLAARVRAEGWTVAGTAREPARVAALDREGIAAHRFDRDHPLADPASALAGATHLLLSVPPDRDGDPVLDRHGEDVAALAGLRWLGYLSTTGVYGDRGGGWVDEGSELRPTSDRARRRVAAEAGWRALARAHDLPLHIFRLAGIYGPGRSVLDQLRAGTARRIDKPGHAFSRIHVEDLARVLRASMDRPRPGAVYNVADDRAAPAADVVAHGARLLGLAPPPLEPFETAELSPMARSFWRDDKRVRNDRVKRELGVRLLYPDYEAGLAAVLAAESAS